MKRILFLLFVLLICNAFSSLAQVEKGKWFVAADGSINFDIGKEKYKTGSTTNSEYSYFDFDFNPMCGYFVIDKLPIGLYFDVYSSSRKDLDDNDKSTESQFILGPFARYYITEYKKLFPFVEGRVGFGTYKDKYSGGDTYKESYFSTRIGGGATYFFAENVGLDLLIAYDYDAYTDKSSDNGGKKSSSTDYKYIYGSVEINIGVVVTFKCK
jgi:hypothetical protein